jgi:hypothetical protein
MKCSECGSEASEQDLFCGECGAILAPAAGEPAVADELAAADSPADAAAFELPLDSLPPAAPPEPAYRDPAYDTPAAPDSRARVAFILGIVSIGMVVLTCLPVLGLIGCIGPVVGIAASVLGFIVKRDIRARGGLEQDWRRANQGMLLGIASLALYFVLVALTIVLGIGLEFLGGY